jgi:SAM-dependent methyltransferase
MENASAVTDHYGRSDLTERVAEALRQAGLGDGILPWKALAPLDQFHVRGPAATAELAEHLQIPSGATVLDVGCGLGGPARHLASQYGCEVTGIDLNQSFVDLATMLTGRTGLSNLVHTQQANALALPFPPASFDLAWTQHVAMNIADRHGLYTGIRTVLKPGGRLAIYDATQGEAGSPHFPVPWARDPACSFLLTPDAMRAALETAGFTILTWNDVTEPSVAWLAEQAKVRAAGAKPPSLGLPLVMGPEFGAMSANFGRNLQERRVRLIQTVAQAPG